MSAFALVVLSIVCLFVDKGGGVSPTITVTRYWTANFSLFKLFVKVAAADKE